MNLVVIFFTVAFLPTLYAVHIVRCDTYELARYRITFIGDWSEEKFPKQYPKFRPHAQWSKLVGRTHNSEYKLWSLGETATPSFKKFVQEGSYNEMDKTETQGFNGILDAFVATSINAGVGESAVDVFAGNGHTKVSVAVRLIPSPDWFVGADAVDLCVNGSWVHEMTISLDPIDAGTDRGFTFTSPKWASRPHQPMYKITSQYPNHRANSFYYPELDALPNIAFLKFELLTSNKMQRVHRVVNHTRIIEDLDDIDAERKREELEVQQILHGEPLVQSVNDERPVRLGVEEDLPSRSSIEEPASAAVRLRGPSMDFESNMQTRKDFQTYNEDDDAEIIDRQSLKRKAVNADDKEAVEIDQVAADHARRKLNQGSRRSVKIVHRAKSKMANDCLVGAWGPWSACSKTCGFGAQTRYRKVIQAPKNGRPCPALEQEKWCGSMRNCRDEEKLFSWLKGAKKAAKRRSRS